MSDAPFAVEKNAVATSLSMVIHATAAAELRSEREASVKVELSEEICLYRADCRDILPMLGNAAAVITDPPYGMTDSHWDTAPNASEMWALLKAGRESATFVLTASQPFTSAVVLGNQSDFRVEWIWEKNAGSNFSTVKWQPMKEHESVLVFAKQSPAYFPIMEDRAASGAARVKTIVNYDSQPEAYSGVTGKASSMRPAQRFPRSIQKFNRERGLHPNQKPVALIEYFLRTYTKLGDLVLDPYMGSGTTGIACIRQGRRFVGIERDEKYFAVAEDRMKGELEILTCQTLGEESAP